MDSDRDAARVRIFPPAVPVVAILAGVGLQTLWPLRLGIASAVPERYWIGCGIIVAALLGLGLWAVALFRLGGQNEYPWTPTTAIERRGPYRFTRNPMYLQMVLICLGMAVALANGWILTFTPVAAIVLHAFAIRPEEDYLEAKFGDAYRSFKAEVRRWL